VISIHVNQLINKKVIGSSEFQKLWGGFYGSPYDFNVILFGGLYNVLAIFSRPETAVHQVLLRLLLS